MSNDLANDCKYSVNKKLSAGGIEERSGASSSSSSTSSGSTRSSFHADSQSEKRIRIDGPHEQEADTLQDSLDDHVSTHLLPLSRDRDRIANCRSQEQSRSCIGFPRRKAPHSPYIVPLIVLIGTLALTAYFKIFSTLFVYLSWICLGFPVSLFLELTKPKKTLPSVATYANRKHESALSSSVRWLGPRIVNALSLYIWLSTAIIWLTSNVQLLDMSLGDTMIVSDTRPETAGKSIISPSDASQASADTPVFIATNLYNSAALFPQFSDNIITLIHLLGGPSSAYVSVFESNSNDNNATSDSLHALQQRLSQKGVASRIVTGPSKPGDIQDATQKPAIGHIGIEGDAFARIDMLAHVRNMALKPLDEGVRGVNGTEFRYVLWLNDIVFDPHEIVELLHTNGGRFDAACGFDFMPLGLYDTWVTRDTDGNRAKPLWPYFKSSRDIDKLERKKPILVDSCWNGAVAFDARWFLDKTAPRVIPGTQSADNSSAPRENTAAKALAPREDSPILPLRFRGSPRCLSSECLLTSLDLHRALHPLRPWIFMNPKVVVAYDTPTYQMYHDVMRWTLVRPWHHVWERFVSSLLFGWLTDAGRKEPACRDIFKQDWAGPQVDIDQARWQAA